MARTTFATSDAQTKKLWEEKVFREAMKKNPLDRYSSENGSSIVKVQNALEKSMGDAVTFGITMRSTGNWVTNGEQLKGKEEALTSYTQQVSITEYAAAIDAGYPLDRQRAFFSVESETQDKLSTKIAEKYAELSFDALKASPTKVFYGGSATSDATLTSSDYLTPQLLSKARSWAVTGGKRAQSPIEPIEVQGFGNYFLLFIHPEVGYDLRRDSNWAQEVREAEIRGPQNPIFTGARMIHDGVVAIETEWAPLYDTWQSGGTGHGCRCLLVGKSALLQANAKRPVITQVYDDYNRKLSYGVSMMLGIAKTKFNSLDYATVAIDVTCTSL